MTGFDPYYTTGTPYPTPTYAPQWTTYVHPHQREMYKGLPTSYSYVVHYNTPFVHGQVLQPQQPGSNAYPPATYTYVEGASTYTTKQFPTYVSYSPTPNDSISGQWVSYEVPIAFTSEVTPAASPTRHDSISSPWLGYEGHRGVTPAPPPAYADSRSSQLGGYKGTGEARPAPPPAPIGSGARYGQTGHPPRDQSRGPSPAMRPPLYYDPRKLEQKLDEQNPDFGQKVFDLWSEVNKNFNSWAQGGRGQLQEVYKSVTFLGSELLELLQVQAPAPASSEPVYRAPAQTQTFYSPPDQGAFQPWGQDSQGNLGIQGMPPPYSSVVKGQVPWTTDGPTQGIVTYEDPSKLSESRPPVVPGGVKDNAQEVLFVQGFQLVNSQADTGGLAMFCEIVKESENSDIAKTFFAFKYDEHKYQEFKDFVKNYSKADIESCIDSLHDQSKDVQKSSSGSAFDFFEEKLKQKPQVAQDDRGKTEHFYTRMYGFYAIHNINNYIKNYNDKDGNGISKSLGDFMDRKLGKFSLHYKNEQQRFLYWTDPDKVSDSLNDYLVDNPDTPGAPFSKKSSIEFSENKIKNGSNTSLLAIGRGDKDEFGLYKSKGSEQEFSSLDTSPFWVCKNFDRTFNFLKPTQNYIGSLFFRSPSFNLGFVSSKKSEDITQQDQTLPTRLPSNIKSLPDSTKASSSTNDPSIWSDKFPGHLQVPAPVSPVGPPAVPQPDPVKSPAHPDAELAQASSLFCGSA
jgi:hypothetical protein